MWFRIEKRAGRANAAFFGLSMALVLLGEATTAFGASTNGTLGVTATVIAPTGIELGQPDSAAGRPAFDLRIYGARDGAIVVRTVSRTVKAATSDSRSVALKFRGTSLVVSSAIGSVTQESRWRYVRDEICASGEQCKRQTVVRYEMWSF